MLRAKHGKEIVVRLDNEIESLNALSRLMADHGFNILAGSINTVQDKCVLRMISDDTLRAREVLHAQGYDTHEEDVVMVEVPNRVGIFRSVTTALARQDIDIVRMYVTAGLSQATCLIVLHSTDDVQALIELNELK